MAGAAIRVFQVSRVLMRDLEELPGGAEIQLRLVQGAADGGFDIGAIIGQVVGGGVGGAILTAIVGMIKNSMAKA